MDLWHKQGEFGGPVDWCLGDQFAVYVTFYAQVHLLSKRVEQKVLASKKVKIAN